MAISYLLTHEKLLKEIELNDTHLFHVLGVASYVSPILFYLPRSLKDYTDHGIIHSENLLSLLNNFLNAYGRKVLTEDEKYVICLAVYLHDIGCLINRKEHSRLSLVILDHNRFSYLEGMLGKDVLACLKYVILYHQKEYELADIPIDPILPSVRTPLISAIFRLIDECDISSRRTSSVLYDIIMTHDPLGTRSAKHWQSHLSVSSIVFHNQEIIVDTEDPSKSEFLVKRIRKRLRKINGILVSYELPPLGLKVVTLSWSS